MTSLQRCLRIAIAVSTCLSPSVSWAQAAAIYPAVEWDHVAPAQAGWSATQLAQAEDRSREIGSTAVVIVQHGAMVASWAKQQQIFFSTPRARVC